MSKPELKISVFSDYICPFCYVGNKRLKTLNAHYDLKINWCFIETHPETPIDGSNFKDLPYTDEEFFKLTNNLDMMASEEDLSLLKQSITANSHKAILLSEACKALGKETFYQIHNALFEQFFEHGINIGKTEELIKIAKIFGIKERFVQDAIQSTEMARHLPIFKKWAAAFKVTSVPSFVFGDVVLTGAVEANELLEAANFLYQKNIH